jgi:hypothetical protein
VSREILVGEQPSKTEAHLSRVSNQNQYYHLWLCLPLCSGYLIPLLCGIHRPAPSTRFSWGIQESPASRHETPFTRVRQRRSASSMTVTKVRITFFTVVCTEVFTLNCWIAFGDLEIRRGNSRKSRPHNHETGRERPHFFGSGPPKKFVGSLPPSCRRA